MMNDPINWIPPIGQKPLPGRPRLPMPSLPLYGPESPIGIPPISRRPPKNPLGASPGTPQFAPPGAPSPLGLAPIGHRRPHYKYPTLVPIGPRPSPDEVRRLIAALWGY